MRALVLFSLLFSLGANAAEILSNQPPFALTLGGPLDTGF